MAVLTRRSPAPQPKARRRRTEETRGGFKQAAVKILRRIMHKTPPAEAPVWDAMTWQHFWGEHFLTDCSDSMADDFDQGCVRPEVSQESSGFSPQL
jgi:hypothetical protein